MQQTADDRNYVLISTDCHAGGDLRDYKPYLEKRWHEEFEAWTGSFVDMWADVDSESEWQAGISSFMNPLNWDSQKRLEALETEGIVAEVIFPNTVPPFFPNGALAAAGPRTREEYERRWAGLQAHNRWLKDFCDLAPGRRFGIGQLFLEDVDDAVAEIRWAKEAGLRGMLLPGDHHLKLNNIYYRRYDPIWAVCQELGMPIGKHGSVVSSGEDEDSIDEAQAIGVFETLYFAQRSLFQLVLSGVFDRFPDLKFTFTETGNGTWMKDQGPVLDGFIRGALTDGTITRMFAGAAADKLSMRPSEYIARNCWQSTMLTGQDLARRHDVGIDHLMWGADFPHHEGTAPHTQVVLRGLFGKTPTPENEIRQLLADNAAALYGADLDFLQQHADRVGPSVAEINTPLREDEIPADINFAYLRDNQPRFSGSTVG